MRYTIKHNIDIGADGFWKLFFDPAYNEALFLGYLEFASYKVLEERVEPDGVIHRRIDYSPKVDLPGPVRTIFGDSLSFVEVGRYDPAQNRYFVKVEPRVGGDKVKTTNELWVEPRGDKLCERVILTDNTVKAFGLGTLVESFIEHQARDLYGHAAEFTNRWIKQSNAADP